MGLIDLVQFMRQYFLRPKTLLCAVVFYCIYVYLVLSFRMVTSLNLTPQEKAAVDHPGSRTVLLYFATAFLALLVFAIVRAVTYFVPFILLLALGLINLVFILLIYLTFKSRKPGSELLVKKFSHHLLFLFLVSVFVAPFLGGLFLEYTKGEPTGISVFSIICFGYVGAFLVLGVPSVLIYSAVSDKRTREKNTKQAKMELDAPTTTYSESKAANIVRYNSAVHGQIMERKGSGLPALILIVGLMFAPVGLFMNVMGILMATNPAEDTAAGIVCAVFGIPFLVVGIVIIIVYMRSKAKVREYKKAVAGFEKGEGYVTQGRITSSLWYRITTHKVSPIGKVSQGYKIRYAFKGSDGAVRESQGQIETEKGKVFSFIISLKSSEKVPNNLADQKINVVFNDKVSAILGFAEKETEK